MATLKNPLFISLALVFLLHQLAQKVLDIQLPFLDHYLDTFLLAPILLTGLLAEWRDLYQLGNNYVYSPLVVILLTIFLILVSEVIFPAFSVSFTADPLDGLAILLGSLFFYFFLNRPARATAF